MSESIVYDMEGNKYSKLADVNDEWAVVRPILVDVDEYDETTSSEYDGHPKVMQLSQLYKLPPLHIYEPKVKKLIKEIDIHRSELRSLRSKIAKEEAAYLALKTKFNKYAALRRIEEFLDGKLDYVVLTSEYGGIKMGGSELIVDSDRRSDPDKYYKLVTLHGTIKGKDRDFTFRVNRYRDGSGSDEYQAHFFDNKEEAVEFARQKAMEQIEIRLGKVKGGYGWDPRSDRVIAFLNDNNMEIPSEVQDRIREATRLFLQKTVTEAESELLKAMEQLDKV